MEQDLKLTNSIPSTIQTHQGKRPYQKIPQEIRSQILQALTVEKLPIAEVASKFGTKICTCKAILSTYELEGRSEKKTTRRERVEVESKIVLKIIDPLNRQNALFENSKQLKMYTEGKSLSQSEETTLKKKIIQEVSEQLGELQTCCYQLQSLTETNDEKAPCNIIRGINLGLHVVTNKIRESQIQISQKQKVKEDKSAQKNEQVIQVQQQLNQYFRQFANSVNQKIERDPLLIDHLRNLTAATVAQQQLMQRLQRREFQVGQIQIHLKNVLLNMFQNT